MFLENNPFFLLGVHSTDTKSMILQAADNKIFQHAGQESAIRSAQNILTNPRKRIRAELCWPCGLSKVSAYQWVQGIVRHETIAAAEMQQVSFQQMVLLIYSLPYQRLQTAAAVITRIERLYTNLDGAAVMRLLNEDRVQARIARITEQHFIDEGLEELVDDFGTAVSQLGLSLGHSGYALVMGNVVQDYLTKRTAGNIISKCLDVYLMDMMEILTRLEQDVGGALDNIKNGMGAQGWERLRRSLPLYAQLDKPLSTYRWSEENRILDKTDALLKQVSAFIVSRYKENQDVDRIRDLSGLLENLFSYVEPWQEMLHHNASVLLHDRSQGDVRPSLASPSAQLGDQASASVAGIEEIIVSIKKNIHFQDGYETDNYAYCRNIIHGSYSRLLVEFLHRPGYTVYEKKAVNSSAVLAYSLMATACNWANDSDAALLYQRLAMECAKKSGNIDMEHTAGEAYKSLLRKARPSELYPAAYAAGYGAAPAAHVAERKHRRIGCICIVAGCILLALLPLSLKIVFIGFIAILLWVSRDA